VNSGLSVPNIQLQGGSPANLRIDTGTSRIVRRATREISQSVMLRSDEVIQFQ
jgi:hypothetical protein